MLKRLFAICLVCTAASLLRADVNWEAYRQLGHINDYAQVLNDRERMGLERLLTELQMQYGVNLGLFTVPSLERYRIDEMTRYMYEQWDMGRASANQSALMLLNKADGTLHLYVGMGLRGILNNRWTQDLSNRLERLLSKEQFDKASVEGVTMMVSRVYENKDALPKRSVRYLQSKNSFGAMSNAKAMPIASLVAGIFAIGLLVSTLFQAKKTEEFESGTDFERNRTGAFGQKKPQWL